MGLISKLFGKEIEMYKFTYDNVEYYFTSSDKSVTFLNNIYTPLTLKRGDITSSTDTAKNILTIELTKNNDIVDKFKETTPKDMSLIIYKSSRNDLNNYVQIFNGLVKTCSFKVNTATLSCQSLTSLLNRDILRTSYSTLCPLQVYKGRCEIDAEDFSFNAQVTAIASDGINIVVNSVNSNPDDYYTLGVATTDDGQNAMILSQVGTSIKLQQPFNNFELGDNIKLVAGCKRTSDDCINKFNNFKDFKGNEYIPDRDPYQNGL